MRASEKTLELNFCTQFSALVRPRRALWFGPTQRQEAQWRFDASSKLGGQLIIFQFKAPEKRISEVVWRFRVQYKQLRRLQELDHAYSDEHLSVFYGFPLIFSTGELQEHHQLLPRTWLLDVHTLPKMPCPLRKDGTCNMEGTYSVEVRIEEPNHPIAYMAVINQHFLLRCAEDLGAEVRDSRVALYLGDGAEDAPSALHNTQHDQMELLLGGVGVLLW